MLLIDGGFTIYDKPEDIAFHTAMSVGKLKPPDEIYTHEVIAYAKNVMYYLSDIPRDKIDSISDEDVNSYFYNYFYYIYNIILKIDTNIIRNKERGIKVPKCKKVMGVYVPLAEITAGTFAQACDMDSIGGIYEYGNYVVALLLGAKDDVEATKMANDILWLPFVDILEIYNEFYLAHELIKNKHPELFKKPKTNPGELPKTYTWMENLILSASSPDKIDFVKNMNMWDYFEFLEAKVK